MKKPKPVEWILAVSEEKWILPVSEETWRVANLMSAGIGIADYISIAVCTMSVEQLERLSKKDEVIPSNVIIAVDKLHKKVKEIVK